ncbi:MAG: hypothetical protein ABJH06_16600 [Paraglaciecola sp.]|uniref:hypothetical protein n=1 Tax=Paraglaciecola sp. TaxID=1920173 RepID=UPI0032979B5F
MFDSQQYLCIAQELKKQSERLGFTNIEIRQKLELFLETIQAPDDLRGLHFVLFALTDVEPEFKAEFESVFGINAQTLEYLAELINKLAQTRFKNFNNRHRGNGWCTERPVYTLLFNYSDYGYREAKALFLKIFLTHYFTHKTYMSKIGDNRQQESFDSCRLLMLVKNQDDFSPIKYCRILETEKIAKALLDDSNNEAIENKVANNLRRLSHFFALDWGARTSRNRVTIDKYAASRKHKGKLEPIVGSDSRLFVNVVPIHSDGDMAGCAGYLPLGMMIPNSDSNPRRRLIRAVLSLIAP